MFIGDPASAGYRTFRAGIAEYASLLPPNSHGEANPADKDPVPPLPSDLAKWSNKLLKQKKLRKA